MIKKKNSFFILLFVLSFVANVLFIFSYFISKSSFRNQEEGILEIFINKYILENYAESVAINPFESVVKEDGTSAIFNSILESNPKIFLLISDNSCNSCVIHCLEGLSYHLKELGNNNIIVLGHFENKRNFFLFARKFPFRFYLLDSVSVLSRLAARSQNPLFFSIEYPNKIRNAFSPVSTYRTLTDSYLRTVVRLF